ncbi:hypothetical protein Q8A67_024617 [Cirrhinus molitorella]|uniref:Uncharacterized protein n=1 Tax=Cirrhinus molitorella TaxID=172907 RepID=A0AA88P297_9TELE|nr:hypothetical protein Q8A67_024617 [Cirrhinus molitorella]
MWRGEASGDPLKSVSEKEEKVCRWRSRSPKGSGEGLLDPSVFLDLQNTHEEQLDCTQSLSLAGCPIWPCRVKVTQEGRSITSRQVPTGATLIVSTVHLSTVAFMTPASDMTARGKEADSKGDRVTGG